VLHSPAHSRVGRCGLRRFCNLRYRDTQHYPCAREKSPAPRSSSLPPQLTSNSCPMPQVARTAPAKPRDTALAPSPHDNLLLHADPAHNRLTFSDLSSARRFAPLRRRAPPAIKTKQTAHAEIPPETKACPRPFPSPAPSPWPLTRPGPAVYRFPGRPGQSSSKPKHAQAHTDATRKTTSNGLQRREKTLLHKKEDSPTGDAVGQEDLQGRDGPEHGASTEAPEKQSQTARSPARRYGPKRRRTCKKPGFKT